MSLSLCVCLSSPVCRSNVCCVIPFYHRRNIHISVGDEDDKGNDDNNDEDDDDNNNTVSKTMKRRWAQFYFIYRALHYINI